jgi:hypothetical protein
MLASAQTPPTLLPSPAPHESSPIASPCAADKSAVLQI